VGNHSSDAGRVELKQRGISMFGKSLTLVASMAVMYILLMVCVTSIAAHHGTAMPIPLSEATEPLSFASPCDNALEQSAVCDAANRRAEHEDFLKCFFVLFVFFVVKNSGTYVAIQFSLGYT